tara:strand:- start:222 stop:521 length:300 start_codon:yes stop_codon:yes gene_type:complete
MGRDPSIIFANNDLDPSLRCRLVINLESQAIGNAQIFYQIPPGSGKKFDEERSRKFPVVYGMNRLECELPADRYPGAIRFDPLDCEGLFKIHSMDVLPD